MLHCHAVPRGSGIVWASSGRLLWHSAALGMLLSLPCGLMARQEIPAATAPHVSGPQSQTPCRPLQANPFGSERQSSGSRSSPNSGGAAERSQERHAAAALEMDFHGSYLGQGGRRAGGQGNGSPWEDGLGSSSAWLVLAWVWLCGALIAALVFLTYRRLAMRQMQEHTQPTDRHSSVTARRSNTPPPSVKAAPADPWRPKP